MCSRARHSPILLPPPLAERDGQDRGSRLFFMTRHSKDWLAGNKDKKKAPLRVLVALFEARGTSYDAAWPGTERAHPRRAPWAIGRSGIKSCLQRNMAGLSWLEANATPGPEAPARRIVFALGTS